MEQKAVTQAELISVDGGTVKKFDVKAEGDASALGKRISEATLQVWQFLYTITYDSIQYQPHLTADRAVT